jgi:hypothetical protein
MNMSRSVVATSRSPSQRGRALWLLLALAAGACSGEAGAKSESQPPGLEPKKVADMLHAIMEADRINYTKEVVNRLTKDQKVRILNPTSNDP